MKERGGGGGGCLTGTQCMSCQINTHQTFAQNCSLNYSIE